MSDKGKRLEREPFFIGATRNADPQGEKVYTVSGAAKATGLSQKLIRQEIEAGNLPIVDLPGERRTMLRRQDLNVYIQSRVARKVADEEE